MNSSSRRLDWFTRRPLLKLAGTVAGLFVLWHLGAYPRGMIQAKIDIARGDYRIKFYGYPAPWNWPAAQKLRDRYGIELEGIGDDVTVWEVWYVDGYRSVALPAIEARYGDGVDQCFEEARAEYDRTRAEAERAKLPPSQKDK